MAKRKERPPAGPVGRFIPCPANSDSHPERLALEVKRSWDKNDKERFSAFCPLCNSRIFLNNWKPGPRSRTIVQAEAEGLHPVGINPDHKSELLAELGLREAQPNPATSAVAPPSPWPARAAPPPGYVPIPQAHNGMPYRRKKKKLVK